MNSLTYWLRRLGSAGSVEASQDFPAPVGHACGLPRFPRRRVEIRRDGIEVVDVRLLLVANRNGSRGPSGSARSSSRRSRTPWFAGRSSDPKMTPTRGAQSFFRSICFAPGRVEDLLPVPPHARVDRQVRQDASRRPGGTNRVHLVLRAWRSTGRWARCRAARRPGRPVVVLIHGGSGRPGLSMIVTCWPPDSRLITSAV